MALLIHMAKKKESFDMPPEEFNLTIENVPLMIENAMLKCYAKERDDLSTVGTQVAEILSLVNTTKDALAVMKVDFTAALKRVEDKVSAQNGRIATLEKISQKSIGARELIVGVGAIVVILEPIALKFLFK